MTNLFPFNLPGPTVWYVVLYVLTLLMHALFMSYVLAGSIMLGVAGTRGMLGRHGKPSAWASITTILKDWMPFALSAAITAGVAPLLFVQILYQQEFYTANLLSFHRWMAILPVLIIAFYLLYLLKAHRIEGKTAIQGIVAMVVMACVLFVGWSWVENHLLSIDRAAWTEQYKSNTLLYTNPDIIPRLFFWIAAALPTTALMLAWQLKAGASEITPDDAKRSIRPLAWLGIISLAIATLAAMPILLAAQPDGTLKWNQPGIVLWMGVALAGAAAQTFLWLPSLKGKTPRTTSLLVGSAGLILFWLGILATRELVRVNALTTPAILARHERVGTIAGLVIFLAFAVLSISTIAWIVRSVAVARNGYVADKT